MRTESSFVNRAQELASLERALADVWEGRPRVHLLRGQAGIGKTRLLRELRRQAEERGFSYWYGQGYEDLRLPYRPFVEALLPGASELARLASDPALIRRFLEGGAEESAGPPQEQADRHVLFVALSRAVIERARRGPTLLVLDDLHWADRPSVDLFEHVVFALAQAAQRGNVALMVIGTLRPGEPDDRLIRMLARIRREPVCEFLDLEGFGEEHTGRLIEALGVAHPSHQLVTTVRTATRGNPLFVEGVVQDLQTLGALQERGGFVVSEIAAADLGLPDDVTTAIARRTQRVSEETRRLLTLAAFLGLEFDLGTLGELCETDERHLLDVLERAMQERLLESAGGDAFRFTHPLIRHVLYNEPSEPRRQRIHAQIADHLEGRPDLNESNRVLDLAHHLIRARSRVEPDRVLTYAQQAAHRAFSIGAWDEAARFYEAALRAGATSGTLSEGDRATLHYRAGYAYNRDFDVGPCLDHYEKAIDAFRDLGDAVGLARAQQEKTRAAYTFGSVAYGTLTDVEPLERALEGLGESEPQLRAACLDTLANAYWTARDQEKARELAARALEMGRQVDDDSLCARACGTLALTELQSLHLREALEISQRGLKYARRSGDLKLVEQRLLRIPLWLFWLGRLDEAESVTREARELGEATHDWGESSLSIAARVSVAVARGDFDGAEEHAREVMAMVHRSHYPWAAPIALFSLACARALRGSPAEAEDALDLLLEPGRVFEDPAPFRSTVQLYRALVRAYSDPTKTPEIAVRERRRRGSDGFDISAVAPLCAEVELLSCAGTSGGVEHLYQALSLALERGVLFPSGWVFLIPRILGVAAKLEGNFEAAAAHFESAIELAEARNARPELGRAWLDFADMLIERDAEGDRDRAAKLLGRADSVFAELEMEPFRKRVAEKAAALGMSVTARPNRRSLAELSSRDVAVLDRIARGRSDEDIADDLLLSRKTVAQHVGSVLEKIEADGRTAASAYALERGLGSVERVREAVATYRSEGDAREPLVIMVSDIQGSTELIERLGDERARDLLHTHNVIVRACIHEHAGSEIQQTGDGFLMYFYSAPQALACAVSIQQRLSRYNRDHADFPLWVRIGVHAGHPLPHEGRLVGLDVNTAARICSAAQSGEILASEEVRHYARDAGFSYVGRGPTKLKGRSQPLRLFSVGWE